MSKVSRTAIIGTGTMGPGMGAVLARAGVEVRLYDVRPEAMDAARAAVALAEKVLDGLDAPSEPGGSISYGTDLSEALDGCDFVIEAVPEKLELKQQVFADIEAHVADTAIISSNTSGIPITDIAKDLQHPGRVVGMHWSNPPHLIPMIEVVPGEKTDSAVLETTNELIERFGYRPVLIAKEVPGFVENRILYAIMRECLELVDQGVISRADMDTCVKWGIGYKLAVIGPLELLDVAGLDIYESVASYLNPDLSTQAGISSTITDLTGQGRLGMKTDGGIYDYTPEEKQAKGAERAGKLVAVRKALG